MQQRNNDAVTDSGAVDFCAQIASTLSSTCRPFSLSLSSMIPASSIPLATHAVQPPPAAAASLPASSLSAASTLGSMAMRSLSSGSNVIVHRVGAQYQTPQEEAVDYAKVWATKTGNPYTAMAWAAASGSLVRAQQPQSLQHQQLQQQQHQQQHQQMQQHSPPPDLADVGPLLQLHASVPSTPTERPNTKAALQRRISELEDQLRSAHTQNASLIAQLSVLKPSVRSCGTQTTDSSHSQPGMGGTEEESKQLTPSPVPPASSASSSSSVEPDAAAILAAVESLMAKPAPPVLPRGAELSMPSMQMQMPMPMPSALRIVPSAAAASYALPAVVVAAASSSSVLDDPSRPALKLAPLYSPVAAASSPAESGGDEDLDEDLDEDENDNENELEQEENDAEQDEEIEAEIDAHDGPELGPEPKPKRAAATKPKTKATGGSGSGNGAAASASSGSHKKSVLHPFPSSARRSSDRFTCPFVNCANSFALCSRRTIKRHVIECAYKDAKVGPLLRSQRFGDEQIEYDAVKHLLLTVKKFAPKELKGFIFRQHKEKRDKHVRGTTNTDRTQRRETCVQRLIAHSFSLFLLSVAGHTLRQSLVLPSPESRL